MCCLSLSDYLPPASHLVTSPFDDLPIQCMVRAGSWWWGGQGHHLLAGSFLPQAQGYGAKAGLC